MNANKNLVNRKSELGWYKRLNNLFNSSPILTKISNCIIIISRILSALLFIITLCFNSDGADYMFVLFITFIVAILCWGSILFNRKKSADEKICMYISSYAICGIIFPIFISTACSFFTRYTNIELVVAGIGFALFSIGWCIYNVKHAKEPEKDYPYIQLVLQGVCGILTLGGFFYNRDNVINQLYLVFLGEYLLLPLYVQYKIICLPQKKH